MEYNIPTISKILKNKQKIFKNILVMLSQKFLTNTWYIKYIYKLKPIFTTLLNIN